MKYDIRSREQRHKNWVLSPMRFVKIDIDKVKV